MGAGDAERCALGVKIQREKMRKLKLQMQTSVDGFVAGPNGEQDWMVQEAGDDGLKYVNEMLESVDLILLGRKMTEGFINHWSNVVINQPDSPEFPLAKKLVDTPKIVFTKTFEKSNWDNTTLAKGNLTDEINRLKNQSGKDIIVYGGAGFVSSLIKENLIDEYNFVVNPTILGKGMTIFNDLEDKLNLQLVKSKSFDSGEVLLCYEPRR